ncbi:hypothetical protein K1719_004734 [Acacia pycnantha]|nr:hypothetical protein K1719_004734 [Acacia pycnantha]
MELVVTTNQEPNTKSISCTAYFESNSKFADKKRRIKILLHPVHEKKKAIKDVIKNRKYTIDVTILRIMKSWKVLSHQQLVEECLEQLGRIFKQAASSTFDLSRALGSRQ